jgi:hypothetical protein
VRSYSIDDFPRARVRASVRLEAPDGHGYRRVVPATQVMRQTYQSPRHACRHESGLLSYTAALCVAATVHSGVCSGFPAGVDTCTPARLDVIGSVGVTEAGLERTDGRTECLSARSHAARRW